MTLINVSVGQVGTWAIGNPDHINLLGNGGEIPEFTVIGAENIDLQSDIIGLVKK